MSDWNQTLLSTQKVDVETLLSNRDQAVGKMDFAGDTNVPTDFIRFSRTNSRFEVWNGSAWVVLSTGYSINVGSFGGQSPAFYRDADNLNSGTVAQARLPGATILQAGIAHLSAATTSTSTVRAATPSAVNAVRQLAETKAPLGHGHLAGDLPGASTGAVGVVQLNATVSSTSTTQAATASAVKAANDNANTRSPSSHGHPLATVSQNGFMSATDKQTLAAALSVTGTAADSNELGGVGAASYARKDQTPVFNVHVRLRYGANGAYGNESGGTTNWGAPIWGMGDLYDGSPAGSTFQVANMYGLAWIRSGHTLHDARIGEGLYVYRQGGLRGGIGTAGIFSTTRIGEASDARYKTAIRPIAGALLKLWKITGVTFERVGMDGDRQAGFLAQEVRAVLPEAVSGTDDDGGQLGVSISGVVGLVGNAVRSLSVITGIHSLLLIALCVYLWL